MIPDHISPAQATAIARALVEQVIRQANTKGVEADDSNTVSASRARTGRAFFPSRRASATSMCAVPLR